MRFVGQAPAFLSALRLLARIALFDVPALIEGETGTGKELAARFVHYQSGRRDRPFVPVTCGALADTLVENELFGHERGAYTDAQQSSTGLVGLADGGSLFLDEIDALSPKAQVALLRFLQDQRYRPVGSTHDRRADVRVIAASNQALTHLARHGLFRSDLLFRIKVMSVELPPLRARPGDARMLAEHFLDECHRRYRGEPKWLHASTLAWIDSHDWPGNVRELENFIHRGFVLTEGPELLAPDPPLTAGVLPGRAAAEAECYRSAKAAAISAFDRQFLRTLLARECGNVTRAARAAGKDRRALGRLLKNYGIRPSDFQAGSAP
jgi:two-component system response regulator GlrR